MSDKKVMLDIRGQEPDTCDYSALLVIAGEAKNGDKFSVNLYWDGTITYTDGYEPDEAAVAFWEAMAKTPNIRAALEKLAAAEEGA